MQRGDGVDSEQLEQGGSVRGVERDAQEPGVLRDERVREGFVLVAGDDDGDEATKEYDDVAEVK